MVTVTARESSDVQIPSETYLAQPIFEGTALVPLGNQKGQGRAEGEVKGDERGWGRLYQ